jgi:hypothetical protein
VHSLTDIDWRMQRIPTLEFGIFAMGAEEFAEEFANEPNPSIRCTKIQTKTFLIHHKKLLSLQSQDARLRRHRQQDEERLQRLQADRRYQEAKQQQASAQAAAKSAAATTPARPVGFEFRDPGPGRAASWMSPAEVVARFRQADEMEARGEKVYDDDAA